ncbi:F-box domain containing protein [Nitzschia inconspicua]|uniref:F-box domain containing protein n=1 Tax=Nitzschia inconspicua TaxID=303405 RepID=A0A9K3PWC0_9STRA|nr:F-box domain containing protein [Nitzschia inconspicua]
MSDLNVVSVEDGNEGIVGLENENENVISVAVAAVTHPNSDNNRAGVNGQKPMASSIAVTASPTLTTIQAFSPTTDQLERCGRWLSSIPRDDVTALRDTPEYHDFLQAFERLGYAHRRVISCNNNRNEISPGSSPTNSLWSSLANGGLGMGTSSNASSTGTINSGTWMNDNIQTQRAQLRSAISDFAGTNVPSTLATAISSAAKQPLAQQPHIHPSLTINAFLQHTDDVILRVFEFLESQSLIRASLTCSRFHQLAHRGATQRTYQIARTRQLYNVMQLLRAHEQIFDGDQINHNTTLGHVRVPMLLLRRRIVVSDAGDPEYNGVYYCTNSNGNGFVFTKPRHPIQRVSDRRQRLQSLQPDPSQQQQFNQRNNTNGTQGQANNNNNNNAANVGNIHGLLQRPQIQQLILQQRQQHPGQRVRLLLMQNQNVHQAQQAQQPAAVGGVNGNPPHQPVAVLPAVVLQQQQQQQQQPIAAGVLGGPIMPDNDNFSSTRYDGEIAQPGQPLRCIISKRFSNETILWYMSKEVEAAPMGSEDSEEDHEIEQDGIREVFSYWSKLMVLGAASPDVCRYPSQTSILSRQGDGWQSLAVTQRPPTVELLD